MSVSRASAESFYRGYLGQCNSHAFDRLGEFVAEDVEVNGEIQGLQGYIAGLETVICAFPDYRWDLRRLLVDGCWLAAHLIDTGTHKGTFHGVPATGRQVTMQEITLYRVHEDTIAEVWVTADNERLLRQLRQPHR